MLQEQSPRCREDHYPQWILLSMHTPVLWASQLGERALADGQALPLCGLKKVIYGGGRQRWVDERLGCKGKQRLGGAGFSL